MHVSLKTNLSFEETLNVFDLRLMGERYLKRLNFFSVVICIYFSNWFLLSQFLSSSHLKYVKSQKCYVEFALNTW